MPFQIYQIVYMSTTRVFFQFDFLEIDSWDGDHLQNGMDTFGVEISGDITATVNFGHFKYSNNNLSDGGTSPEGIVCSYNSKSRTKSGQGYSSMFHDQRHSVTVEVPK